MKWQRNLPLNLTKEQESIYSEHMALFYTTSTKIPMGFNDIVQGYSQFCLLTDMPPEYSDNVEIINALGSLETVGLLRETA